MKSDDKDEEEANVEDKEDDADKSKLFWYAVL